MDPDPASDTTSRPDDAAGDADRATGSLRPRVLPWVVLACTLLSTACVVYYIWSKDRLRADSSARAAAQQARDLIQSRVDSRIALLRGAGGLVSNHLAQGALRIPSCRDEFTNFVERLELERNYRSVRGLGFALRLRPDERAGFERAMQKAGVPEYQVWTDVKDYDLGHAPDVFPMVYAAPLRPANRGVLGFD